MSTKLKNKIELDSTKEINMPTKYVFFGTGPLAEAAIYNLYHGDCIPEAIITKPDANVGRDHVLTAPIIKVWANSKGIQVYQPSTLKKEILEDLYQKYLDLINKNEVEYKENLNSLFTKEEINNINFYKYIKENNIDIAIVASYGKIIPEYILDWPLHGILNIHPSMLPICRGPSPIESQLLDGCNSIGLSIMKLDKGMDSGPVYIQKSISLNIKNNTNINKDYNSETIERVAGREGAEMILQILPFVMDNSLKPKDQDNDKATFCKFIEKSQGDITDDINIIFNNSSIILNEENLNSVQEALNDDQKALNNKNISVELVNKILHKWRALNPWPGIYFFINHNEKKLRVKINKINVNGIEISKFILEVTPEGKRPMNWESFVNGYMTQPHPINTTPFSRLL